MGIGNASDFKIYQEQLWGGFQERYAQNLDLMNQASLGCIMLEAALKRGEFELASFFTRMSGLVSRRDTTSNAGLTDGKLAQGELVTVKVNRKIGPVSNTLDSFKKIGMAASQEEISFRLGEQVAEDVLADQVNTAIGVGVAAVGGQSGLVYNAVDGTLAPLDLNEGFALFGDAAARLRVIVCHSKVYHNLIGQAVTDKVYEVAGAVLRGAAPATFGRPCLVTDSPNLVRAAGDVVTNIGATATGNKFTKTGITAALGVVVGDYITVAGFADAANNGVHRVIATAADEVTVASTLVTEAAEVGQTGQRKAHYRTLLLSDMALMVQDSEERTLVDQLVTGEEQLRIRLQGEFAYNLGARGMSWDRTNGGANPVDADLLDPVNWLKAYTSNKNLPGVRIDSL